MPAFGLGVADRLSSALQSGKQGFNEMEAIQAERQRREQVKQAIDLNNAREQRTVDLHAGNLESQALSNESAQTNLDITNEQRGARLDALNLGVEGQELTNTKSQQAIDIAEENRDINLEQSRAALAATKANTAGINQSNAIRQDTLDTLDATKDNRLAKALVDSKTNLIKADVLNKTAASEYRNLPTVLENKDLELASTNLIKRSELSIAKAESMTDSAKAQQYLLKAGQQDESFVVGMAEQGKIRPLVEHMIDSPFYGVDDAANAVWNEETKMLTLVDESGKAVWDEKQNRAAEYDMSYIYDSRAAAGKESKSALQKQEDDAAMARLQIKEKAETTRAEMESNSSSASPAKPLSPAEQTKRVGIVRQELKTQFKEAFGLDSDDDLTPDQRELLVLAEKETNEYLGLEPIGAAAMGLERAQRIVELRPINGKDYDYTIDEIQAEADRLGVSYEEFIKDLPAKLKEYKERNG